MQRNNSTVPDAADQLPGRVGHPQLGLILNKLYASNGRNVFTRLVDVIKAAGTV